MQLPSSHSHLPSDVDRGSAGGTIARLQRPRCSCAHWHTPPCCLFCVFMVRWYFCFSCARVFVFSSCRLLWGSVWEDILFLSWSALLYYTFCCFFPFATYPDLSPQCEVCVLYVRPARSVIYFPLTLLASSVVDGEWNVKTKLTFQFRWFISNTFPRYCNLLPCILAVLILVHMKSHLIPTFVFYRNAIITKQDFIFKFRVHSGFFCTEHVSLLPHYRVDRHGNSCCNHNLLWSRLCSRLEVNRYEITDYWPVISLETSISNPIRQYCSIIYSI